MTMATFVAALSDLSITGVTRIYDEPPAQVSTADAPIAYPRLPEQEREIISFDSSVGLASQQCEMVVLVEPVMQSTNSANFAAMVAIVDAIDTALTNAAATIGIDRWQTRQETAVLGETEWWALVTTVEAS